MNYAAKAVILLHCCHFYRSNDSSLGSCNDICARAKRLYHQLLFLFQPNASGIWELVSYSYCTFIPRRSDPTLGRILEAYEKTCCHLSFYRCFGFCDVMVTVSFHQLHQHCHCSATCCCTAVRAVPFTEKTFALRPFSQNTVSLYSGFVYFSQKTYHVFVESSDFFFMIKKCLQLDPKAYIMNHVNDYIYFCSIM